MSAATSTPVFYSPFTHPTSPRMLSWFPLSASSQIALPSQGEADSVTALLKTLQGHPFSLRIKSNGHSTSTSLSSSGFQLLFRKYNKDTPDSPSWKHLPPSETPSSPKHPQAQTSYFLPAGSALTLPEGPTWLTPCKIALPHHRFL